MLASRYGYRRAQTQKLANRDEALVHYVHSPASKLHVLCHIDAARTTAIPEQMIDWSLQRKRTLRFEIHGQHGLTPRLPEHGFP